MTENQLSYSEMLQTVQALEAAPQIENQSGYVDVMQLMYRLTEKRSAYLSGGPPSLDGKLITTSGEEWLSLHYPKPIRDGLDPWIVKHMDKYDLADYQLTGESPQGNLIYTHRPRTPCIFHGGPANGYNCTMNLLVSDEIVRLLNGTEIHLEEIDGCEYVLTNRTDDLGRRVLEWVEPEQNEINWINEGF